MGEWSSLTSNVMIVRAPSIRAPLTAIWGGVLSISNAVLSSSPVSATSAELDGESEATIFTK